MSKNDQNINWYHRLANYLSQRPFFYGESQDGARLLFEKLGEAIERGDSCLIYDHNSIDCLDNIQDFQPNQPMHKPLIWDAPYLYLQRYWALEQQLAQSVHGLIAQDIQAPQQDFSDLFEDPQQKMALQKGISLPFCMITGGPGTGKTYILTRIVAALKSMNPQLRIAMAAPTGKAAQRMQEALQYAFADQTLLDAGLYHPDFKQQQTQTLHRLLGMGNRQVARYHQDNPLPYDVVVVDEASMLDLSMAKALFSAIQPPTRLILLGDANQLSSVDVGYVLADLQQVPQLKNYHETLLKSRRFSDQAMIGRFAQYIYQGKNCIQHLSDVFAQAQQHEDFSLAQWKTVVSPKKIQNNQFDIELKEDEDWVGYFALNEATLAQHLIQVYDQLAQGFNGYLQALDAFKIKQIDKKQLAKVFDEYRILVAMRHGSLGLTQINKQMTQYVQQFLKISLNSEWYLGRPVMMTYNDYQLGLSNGDIGICLSHEDPLTQQINYSVYFPSLDKEIAAVRLPQSVQTAYALTIHKSQGSEFRHTAVVLDEKAETLLSKELLYTAITRAKKMVSVYASQAALEQSFRIKTTRQSGLLQQLQRILANKNG